MKDYTSSNQQLVHLQHQRHQHFRLIGWDTLLLSCICIAFSIYFQVDGIIPVFVFSVYLLLITSLFQVNWLHRLLYTSDSPLHQHPSFDLFKLCSSHIGKVVANAIFIFIPTTIILGSSYGKMLICAAAYIGYGMLLTSINVLAEQVFGRSHHRLVLISFYLLMMIVFIVPGVILGFMWAFAWTLFDPILVILLGTIVWNVALSLLLLLPCRSLFFRIN